MSLLSSPLLRLTLDGRKILDGIDASIEPGAMIALLGPNGSGKTTLLQSLAGMLDAGPVIFGEKEGRTLSSTERAAHALYVGSGISTAFPVKTEDVFEAAGVRDTRACKRMLAELGCERIWGAEVSSLSAGERQVLLLARGLLRSPRVLLLDETLSKLDLHHLGRSLSILKRFCEQGGAVLWVSHDWNLSLQHASVAWILHEGRWVARGNIQTLPWNEILTRVFPHSNVRAETLQQTIRVTLT